MKRRILCLDGGGIKGLFAATILSKIEELTGNPVFRYFDMISGTSTGAIIAAGIALGIPASQICDLYVKHAPQIFPQDKKLFRHLRQICSSKYTNTELSTQPEGIFQNFTVGDCRTRLLIPSYNLSTGKVQVFKTSHADDLKCDYKLKLVDVLLATTAAPTYLPPHRTPMGTYIDGGIGANNPSLLALAEAVSSRCQWPREDIYLLSLGCTESISEATTGREKMGALDVLKIISTFMNAESQYSHNIVQILLSPEQYLRVNPVDRGNQGSLDKSTPETLHYLQAMGNQQFQSNLEKMQSMFFDGFAEPFHPCHFCH